MSREDGFADVRAKLEQLLSQEIGKDGGVTPEGLAALQMMKAAEARDLLPVWCTYACTRRADVLKCALDGESNIDCLDAVAPCAAGAVCGPEAALKSKL